MKYVNTQTRTRFTNSAPAVLQIHLEMERRKSLLTIDQQYEDEISIMKRRKSLLTVDEQYPRVLYEEGHIMCKHTRSQASWLFILYVLSFFIWGGFLCDHSWFPWNRDLETQTLIHVQSCDEQDCLNNKSHCIHWISICIYRISVCIYRILLFPKSVCVCQKQFLCRCPNLNWFHHVDKKTKNNALIVNIW